MKPDLTKTGHSTKHKGTFVRNSKVIPKLVSDNKNFWQTIKPYVSDKGNQALFLLLKVFPKLWKLLKIILAFCK